MHVEDIPWVADHKVSQDVVFPMAGYVAIVGDAAWQMTGVGSGYGPWRCDGVVVMGLRSEMDLSDARNPTNWRCNRRMGSYHNARRTSRPTRTPESKLQAFLASAEKDPAILRSEECATFIAEEIGRRVQSIMLREGGVAARESLASLGVDSLVATEVGRWIWRVFGVRVGVLEVWEGCWGGDGGWDGGRVATDVGLGDLGGGGWLVVRGLVRGER